MRPTLTLFRITSVFRARALQADRTAAVVVLEVYGRISNPHRREEHEAHEQPDDACQDYRSGRKVDRPIDVALDEQRQKVEGVEDGGDEEGEAVEPPSGQRRRLKA